MSTGKQRRYVGSSPLTRGKRPFPLFGKTLKRLIPAHAGKTLKGQEPTRVRAAHPRSRGENLWETLPNGGRRGSSPLTRGKRKQRAARRVLRGLIPAHAGKTR